MLKRTLRGRNERILGWYDWCADNSYYPLEDGEMKDYSEHMVRIKNTIPKLEDALSKRKWEEARRLAHGIEFEIGSVILIAAQKEADE
jgi:hypothetical protein